MMLQELFSSSRDQQLEWLETRFLEEANAAKQDIELYISLMAWDEPLGSLLQFDVSTFDQMLKYPNDYDLGWLLQERLPTMEDERAIRINEGGKLTASELDMAKALLTDRQIEDTYRGEEGLFCSGSSIELLGEVKGFISFIGEGRGQGGINYNFYRIFIDRRAAIQHFETLPDIWLPML